MLLIPSPDESTSQTIENASMGVRDMNGMIITDTFHPSGDEDPEEQR